MTDAATEVPADTALGRLCARFGVGSLLRVPLPLGTHVFGSLFFIARDVNQFSDADMDFGARVADHLALALSHKELADAARRDEEARQTAARLEAQVATLSRELEARSGVRRVVGRSRQWKDVLAQATRVAQTETTVLLTGESGTGKEVVARYIHHASRRSGGPFIAINCAALPDQLLESELFGHERGAFTGAVTTKPGRIEQASGGVLFLDEVGEMATAVQAKLLRALEEREFTRLGGNRVIRAEVRLIAATNRNLPEAIERGAFREDLYYRLSVFEIALPPLRERAEDILELADSFLAEIGQSVGRPAAGIAPDAKEHLLAYRWPGNVRELRNAIERAVILADGGLIRSQHLPVSGAGRAPAPPRSWPGAAARRRGPGRDRAIARGQCADPRAPQQDAGRQAARADPRAAVLAHREVRAPGSGAPVRRRPGHRSRPRQKVDGSPFVPGMSHRRSSGSLLILNLNSELSWRYALLAVFSRSPTPARHWRSGSAGDVIPEHYTLWFAAGSGRRTRSAGAPRIQARTVTSGRSLTLHAAELHVRRGARSPRADDPDGHGHDERQAGNGHADRRRADRRGRRSPSTSPTPAS